MTRETLASGQFMSIINCLMQLRKVCNHPDLFEVRPIVTSFSMPRSAVADFEIKDLLTRKRLLAEDPASDVDLTALNLVFSRAQPTPLIASRLRRALDASHLLPSLHSIPPDIDLSTDETEDTEVRTVEEWRQRLRRRRHAAAIERLARLGQISKRRCELQSAISAEAVEMAAKLGGGTRLLPSEVTRDSRSALDESDIPPEFVKSYNVRAQAMDSTISRFGFATPNVVAKDLASLALNGMVPDSLPDEAFEPLRQSSVRLSIAFPDRSLLQYDCGKLQKLDELLRELKEGGHRALIFTQMTKVLDILEAFLNFHGHRYLRLDGATKIEQRQVLTERFNNDPRILCFISSTRAGGLGINLTGADTVIFYECVARPV
jgi:helicase SWR1